MLKPSLLYYYVYIIVVYVLKVSVKNLSIIWSLFNSILIICNAIIYTGLVNIFCSVTKASTTFALELM